MIKMKQTQKQQSIETRRKICAFKKPDQIQALSKQDLIMKSLTNFFCKNPENIVKMLPILNKTANISLRILDWFVTNYAKKKNVHYVIPDTDKQFNVYLNYKAQLKAYSKKLFDPFCRKWRKHKGQKIYDGIEFHYDRKNPKKYIETTVGQLNFFKWAISNGVLDFIIDYLQEIVDDMLLSTKPDKQGKSKSKKAQRTKGKRKELSISATRTITKQQVKVVVSFD